jgi:hypothetical protein
MRRQRFDPYAKTGSPHYIVRWDMQHKVIELTVLEPDADLRAAMALAMQRLELDGWTFESDARNGSVFLNRDGERALLGITPHDPRNSTHISYSQGITYPTLETACLAQITKEFYVGAHCRKCKHGARLNPDTLRAKLGGDYPVRRLRERLKCDWCGDKRQIVMTFLTPDERAGNLVHLFDRPT